MHILIEGPDLVGKSTIARELTKRLKTLNIDCIHKKGMILKYFGYKCLALFPAPNYPKSKILNWLYILMSFFDKFIYKPPNSSSMIICESYVDRAIEYGKTLGFGLITNIAFTKLNSFFTFDLGILLISNLETRRKRLERRVLKEKNEIDLITTESTEIHDQFITNLQHIMKRHKKLYIFDTSQSTSDKIINEIITILGNELC